MASVNNFRTLIRRASDTNNSVKISPQGRIKIINNESESTGCFTWFFRENYSDQDAKFSYEVINSIIEIIKHGEVSDETETKVAIASNAVFKKFKHEIKTLEEDELEALYSLPGYLSMHLMCDANVQKQEYLKRLNSTISESIGGDLNRIIHNKCLIIEVGSDDEGFEPDFSFPESIEELCTLLAIYFKLSVKASENFVNTVLDKKNNTYFERYFGKDQDLDDLDDRKVTAMKYFLNGITQSQYNLASGILTILCNQTKRVAYVNNTHDTVSLSFEGGNVVVQHYFDIELSDPQTVICVDTIATFDWGWKTFSMGFKVKDLDNATEEEWAIQQLFERSGYVAHEIRT